MPYVIGPDTQLQRKHDWNWSIADWGRVCRDEVGHPECVHVQQMTYLSALHEYARQAGYEIQPDKLPFNLNYRSEGALWQTVRATLIRGEEEIAIDRLDQPLETNDLILISHLIC